ncbi:1537_t:CDS:2 [Funneliformis caledonium]|uniref:1537_t:CDS:1 n=1 Tax=Funneliformis caledonium TaxID=1117310 RepID=A0A9N9D5D9_9GLOM|nr:1537_t:CDS:2 [Funneliformis caledonium]
MSINSKFSEDENSPSKDWGQLVISPNMECIVTLNEDNSLTVWNVYIEDGIFELSKQDKNDNRDVSLRGLSNDKLLIFKEYICKRAYATYRIRNMETLEDIRIIPDRGYTTLHHLPDGEFLSLQSRYLHIYSRESLKKSKKSPCSYKSKFYLWGIDLVDFVDIVQINGLTFLSINDARVILQLNIETKIIENYYYIPEKVEDWDRRLKCVVNREENLLAMNFKSKKGRFFCVYSMKNGLQISIRKVENKRDDVTIQFINVHGTEMLILYSLVDGQSKIYFELMCPYDPECILKDEYDIPDVDVRKCMIVEAPTPISQYKILFTTENQIMMINFIISEDIIKNYPDPMMHPHNLVMYYSFNDIKNSSYCSYDFDYTCKGKKLEWRYNEGKLFVYKIDEALYEKKNVEALCEKKLRFNFKKLKILSNDDVVIYSDDSDKLKNGTIFIFDYNESKNKIELRYFYHCIEEFRNCTSLPNPSVDLFFRINSRSDRIYMFDELLGSRKYLIEMIDDFINYAIVWKESKTLGTIFNRLYEFFNEDTMENYRICCIITKQVIWNWKIYIVDPWNWFDLSAYFFPVFTSIYWLFYEKPPLPLISISNLFLHFKFMTYLRAFCYFGPYFTIIIGVARRIIYFLFVLFLIIISFAHAFYIILTPNENYDLEQPVNNNDPNNPWNLVNKYQSVTPEGKINSEIVFVQQPDSNVNQFSTYQSSLFAMYLFLTGDSSAFSSWSVQENPFMAILLTMFSFMIVVYLMNLFIGLLNLEIEESRASSLVLLQKARILAEIELFLLLPHQRRWHHWFPDTIYYEMPIEEVRQMIIKIIESPPSDNKPFISNKLRKLVDLKEREETIDYKKLIIDMKDDFTKQMESRLDEIRILLNKNYESENEKSEKTISEITIEVNDESN